MSSDGWEAAPWTMLLGLPLVAKVLLLLAAMAGTWLLLVALLTRLAG
jgi:hypothetical protein